MNRVVCLSDYRRSRCRVCFTRTELAALFALYRSRVMLGDWKDYAIDHGDGMAVFTVFRHAHQRPAYAVAKRLEPHGSGPDYAVFDGARRLKRSSSLTEVLTVLQPRLRLRLVTE